MPSNQIGDVYVTSRIIGLNEHFPGRHEIAQRVSIEPTRLDKEIQDLRFPCLRRIEFICWFCVTIFEDGVNVWELTIDKTSEGKPSN